MWPNLRNTICVIKPVRDFFSLQTPLLGLAYTRQVLLRTLTMAKQVYRT